MIRDSPQSLVFFGDSICFGQGVTLSKTWVVMLSQALSQVDNKFDFPPVLSNPSKNGRTTRQALLDFQFDVLSHSPDFIYLQYGLNDCNYWQSDNGNPRVSLNAFLANMEELVDRALCSGVKKILIANNHPTLKNITAYSTPSTYYENMILYNSCLSDRFENIGSDVHFIDIFANISLKCKLNNLSISQLLLDDGIHLSEIGHTHYYDILKPEIFNLFGL